MSNKRVLAFDFGASSGRAMQADYDGHRIEIREIHRFSNDPVMMGGTLYWDVLRLLFEIKQGLSKAALDGGFDSVGIDTWGVDFGLLDAHGVLLENPVHYRDARNVGMSALLDKEFSLQRLYEITGIQVMDINTVFQLYGIQKNRPHLLERAKTLLFMPDLLVYMLTGIAKTEYSIASTGQLLDARTGQWSQELLEAIRLPRELFTEIVPSGTPVGRLSPALCEELGIPQAQVVAVGEHDTASAVVSVPAGEKDFVYISCGTWSLFGTERTSPLIGEKSQRYNITNEGGYGGTIRFLKNIIGLWLIQEARRQWGREGAAYSYAELETQALAAAPFRSFIDPDAPEFVPQGDLPRRVREFCERTKQPVPQSVGEVMRCIYESLAMKYRHTFDMLKDVTGKDYPVIHMVGGGTKDKLLCQMTADATGVKVVAGPVEATVLGNVAVQLIAMGEIENLAQAREVIARSQCPQVYLPRQVKEWQEGYTQFLRALSL